jgi:hypothetical protein
MTLPELMFHAERFCNLIEAAIKDCAADPKEDDELRLKINTCRVILRDLQDAFDADELSVEKKLIRAHFRYLVISILWIAFRARRVVDYRLFRVVLMIEAGYTQILVNRR